MILHPSAESDDPHIRRRKITDIRFHFIMQGSDENQFRIGQVQLLPCGEEMMHTFPLDQRADKAKTENLGNLTG